MAKNKRRDGRKKNSNGRAGRRARKTTAQLPQPGDGSGNPALQTPLIRLNARWPQPDNQDWREIPLEEHLAAVCSLIPRKRAATDKAAQGQQKTVRKQSQRDVRTEYRLEKPKIKPIAQKSANDAGSARGTTARTKGASRLAGLADNKPKTAAPETITLQKTTATSPPASPKAEAPSKPKVAAKQRQSGAKPAVENGAAGASKTPPSLRNKLHEPSVSREKARSPARNGLTTAMDDAGHARMETGGSAEQRGRTQTDSAQTPGNKEMGTGAGTGGSAGTGSEKPGSSRRSNGHQIADSSGGGSGTRPPPPGAGQDSEDPRNGATPLRAAKRLQGPADDDFRVSLAKGIAVARANLVSVAIFSFVINLLILAIPIYLFQVSDRVLTSRSVETLVMLTAVVIGALAIYAMLDVVRRFLLMRVAAGFETAIGAPLLSAAGKAAQFGSSREFQVLRDLQQLRNFITGPTLLAIFDAPVAPVYFLAVYMIHPQLGIIVSIAALLLVTIALINQKITAVPFAKANAFSTRANFQAEAMARNGEVVNAMGMIREGVMLWGREMAEALKAQIVAQDRNVLMTGISKFLRLSTQVSMLGWGAYLALDGQLTGGMMIAASIVGSRALAPVEGLIEGWRGYVQARGGFARIKALLNSSPLNLERLLLPHPKGVLSVERVLFVPPPTKKVILNGINFALNPGESLAIVGPSGTGKSTLVKMLVGSITPTSGAIRLDLMDIRNWDPRQFGETVGYLPQEVQLFPATIKANIARLREDVSDESIYDAAELTGVHEMISQLPQGYETPIGLDGSPLSGGQKQRLGLARAFFGNPRLVVLDEPNSNLDTAGEIALAAALLRAKTKQITVITVTQRPSLLKSVDKIMLLNEGRVQHLGSRDEVIPKLMSQRAALAASPA